MEETIDDPNEKIYECTTKDCHKTFWVSAEITRCVACGKKGKIKTYDGKQNP